MLVKDLIKQLEQIIEDGGGAEATIHIDAFRFDYDGDLITYLGFSPDICIIRTEDGFRNVLTAVEREDT